MAEGVVRLQQIKKIITIHSFLLVISGKRHKNWLPGSKIKNN